MAVSYRIRRSMALALAALLLGPVLALAQQVPPRMSYQGTLTEGDDTPLEGMVDLSFAFYDREAGGQPLAGWSERYSGVPVRNGRFSVALGSQEGGLPAALFDNRSELWLEVAVDDDPLPRVRLTSTPFAFETQSVVDGAIDTRALVDGAVTGAKLSGDAAVRSLEGQTGDLELTSDDGTVAIEAGGGTIDLSAPGNGGGGGGGITSIQTTGGLAGGGDSPTVTLRIANEGVTTGHLDGGAVTAPKLSASNPSSGQVLGYDGGNLVWRNPGGGGGEGLTSVNTDGTLTGDGTSGSPLGLADRSVTADQLDANPPGDDGEQVLTYEDGQMRWRDRDGGGDNGDDDSAGGPPFSDGQQSSLRFKEDVETLAHATDLVARLRGVRFVWKEDGREDVGVIAEEVAEVLPELVVFDEAGRAERVHYARLTAVLVEAVKAQQGALDARDRTLARQQSEIEALNDRMARLERLLDRRADAGTVPSSSAADH